MGFKQFNFKNILISYLCIYMVFSPLLVYAAPLVADGTTQTVVDKARNNVPVVQIANPNATGLSHNRFTHYNVNKQGLILNNAKTTSVKTQLGGFIFGNKQLTNNAKVILNEVTSSNRSSLRGYTEVAGPRTDLVIANPNGLTINGAGFINTGNVTLTTGKPVIAGGALQSLNITGGDIAIQGTGLNTAGQTSTSIYTQYLNLNAKLHAQNLDLKLGSNNVNYATKNAVFNGAGNARTVLLDASALGGMYANRISLVGTDKGLGVNLPPEVLASTGSITITNDGNISLQKVSAKQQVSVQSANNVTVGNNVYGGTNTTLNAGKAIAINGGITAARNSVSLKAIQLANKGQVIAGLNGNGTKNTTGSVALTANTVSNSGQLQSTGNLSVSAASINNSGNVTATNQLAITTGQLTSTGGELSGTNVNINAANLNSAATNVLAVNNLNLNVAGNVTNAGRMQAGKALNLTATTLDNKNTVQAADVTLATTDITNSGNIASNNNLLINNTNQFLSSGGTIQAANLLDLKSASFDNRGGMTAGNMLLKSAAGANSGVIQSAKDLTATIDAFTNSGNVIAGNLASMNAINSVTNSGTIHANNSNTITTGTLSNSKNITATNQLAITTGQLTSTGGELSGTNVNINAANLNSAATNVLAANDLSLNVTGAVANTGVSSRMQAGRNLLLLNAVSLDNQGLMAAGNSQNIGTSQSINNSGTLHANKTLSLNSVNVTNTKQISSDGTLNLTVANKLNNSNAKIAALGNTNIQAAALDNTNGTLLSNANHTVNVSGALTNAGGVIKSNQNSSIQSTALDNSNGRVDAVGSLTLNAKTINLTNSTLYAGNDATVTMDALDNIATSSIGAGRHLTINAANAITNRSDLLANGNLTLNTNGALLNQKAISSGGALLVNANTLDNAAAATISGGAGINKLIVAGNINNQSRISAVGSLEASGTNIVNNGFFNAGQDLTLSSTNLTNNTTLFAGRNMNLYTTGVLRNNPNANIFTMNNLVMAANAANGKTASIINDRGNIEAYQGNMNLYATSLLNKTNLPVVQGRYVAFVPGKPGTPMQYVPRHRVPATANSPSRVIRAHWIPGTPAVPAIPAHIVGGQRVSTNSVTTGCGFNCQNVTTTTVDATKLISSSPPATISAGNNIIANATNIKNQYSLISAGGNISLASQVVDNQPVDILQVKTISTAAYRNQRFCKRKVWRWCRSWGNRMAYVGTSVSAIPSISNTVSSTIQAGGNITGNVANFTNGNIRKNQVITASTVQTGNTTTTANANTATNAAINNGGTATGFAAKTKIVQGSTTKQIKNTAKTVKVPGATVPTPLINAGQQAIQLPQGNNSLFVVSQKPQSQYLIETNPAFAIYANFISSNYMMQRLNFSPDRTLKRVGDAFYENKLIRDSIFAQTGRRFLNSGLKSDNAQYQYLMDNALKAQKGLQLIPGLTLTNAQIAMLNKDIVWLEEQVVAGQKVLVPVVYIANAHDYKVEGGKVIAGGDINLLVKKLENSDLLEAGNNLNVDASEVISNQGGSIQAGENISLLAKNDIENISASIKAKNIILASTDGSIINKRYTEIQDYSSGGQHDMKTVAGKAGNITATNSLILNAGKTIAITGSKLKAKTMSLNAKQIDISTTVKKSDFFAGNASNYTKEQSVKHLSSELEGDNVSIHSSGKTTIEGSNISAKDKLNIQARKIDILAVNDSSYSEQKSSSKGIFSKSTTTTKKARSTNVASNVSGGNITLSTINDLESTAASGDAVQGNINILGSNVHAKNKLALESAGDINVQAGFDGTLDESHTKKSGWFSGGKIFSKSEDLEGKLTKTAVLSSLSGGDVSLKANKDIALVGVKVVAKNNLEGTAENITVENVSNEEKTYSKHEKMSVGFSNVGKMLTRPDKMITLKNGKASVTLAKAEISKAEKVTTKTEVVSSSLNADNINLTASSDGDSVEKNQHHSKEQGSDDLANSTASKGNITIKGSNLTAKNDVNLTADGDVSVIEAKNTEKTASKEMKGTAELKVTVKNEYVQIAYAVKAAKEAKDNLQKSKSDYDQYKRDLGKQRGKLIKLKADLANGRIGIEQADVDEMASLIDDLKADDAFYKANIALAAADLATKTLAVVTQMSTAVATGGTGFSGSLELDIDVLEKKFNAYKEQSVGSNITAKNININADNTATVRGSNLNASNQIDINAKDTNILASQDVNNSSDSKKHGHLNISYGTAGGSVSASADSAQSSSRGITNQNSRLVASNIHINTGERTTISGANVSASDSLNINSKNLDISSVQDSNNSRSHSQGLSISGGTGGISGAGVNSGMSHSRQKQTVLTTLNGNSVNIDTQDSTTLRGASVAAVDSQGNDNGNLTLKTDTLEVSSLNNRKDSKSMSMGLNVGLSGDSVSSVGIDFTNDRSNSKTKTLGTIGEGTIDVANVDKSNTRMLNRDIKNNEIDIYNVEGHRGLKGTVDTRVFTKKGRTKIAEEIMRSGMIADTIKQIATDKTVGIADFFRETDKQNKTYEAVKKKIAEDPALAAALQNKKLNAKEKEAMLNSLTDAVLVELGYKDLPHENVIVAEGSDSRAGHYQNGKAYINDGAVKRDSQGNPILNDNGKPAFYLDSTGKLVTVASHEVSHAMDKKDGKTNANGEREKYAQNYGENVADFTDMALNVNGYDGGMATSNSHTGNDSNYVVANTNAYNNLDKSKGDDSLVKVAVTTVKLAKKISKMKGKLTKEKFKKLLKDEGLEIMDDVQTLADGELSVDDALALIDLATGLNTNNKATRVAKVDGLDVKASALDTPEIKSNAASGTVKFKRWKSGDAIDKPLPDGSTPSWDVARSRHWKNRASSSGEFSPENLARMRQGKAPLDFNSRTGKFESRELHHVTPQRAGGSNSPLNLRELTPDQHGAVDPFRHTVPTTGGIR